MYQKDLDNKCVKKYAMKEEKFLSIYIFRKIPFNIYCCINIYKISVKNYELVDLLLKQLFVVYPTHVYYSKYTVKYITFV